MDLEGQRHLPPLLVPLQVGVALWVENLVVPEETNTHCKTCFAVVLMAPDTLLHRASDAMAGFHPPRKRGHCNKTQSVTHYLNVTHFRIKKKIIEHAHKDQKDFSLLIAYEPHCKSKSTANNMFLVSPVCQNSHLHVLIVIITRPRCNLHA